MNSSPFLNFERIKVSWLLANESYISNTVNVNDVIALLPFCIPYLACHKIVV